LLFLISFLFPYYLPSLYFATVLVNVLVGILLQNEIFKKSALLLCTLTCTVMERACAWLTSAATAKLWGVPREIKSKSVSGKRARDTGFIPHGMVSDLSHTTTAMGLLSCSTVRYEIQVIKQLSIENLIQHKFSRWQHSVRWNWRSVYSKNKYKKYASRRGVTRGRDGCPSYDAEINWNNVTYSHFLLNFVNCEFCLKKIKNMRDATVAGLMYIVMVQDKLIFIFVHEGVCGKQKNSSTDS
jgi:hypothetical protein